LWSVFQRLFQAIGAVAILDFYHAAQNLYKGASAWLDGRTRACQQWFADCRHRLRHGHEQHVLAELAALVEATPLPPSARQTLINVYIYLKTHEDPIHYEHFKAAGLPIGSGLAQLSQLRHVETENPLFFNGSSQKVCTTFARLFLQ